MDLTMKVKARVIRKWKLYINSTLKDTDQKKEIRLEVETKLPRIFRKTMKERMNLMKSI